MADDAEKPSDLKAIKVNIPFVRRATNSALQGQDAANDEELVLKRFDAEPAPQLATISKHIPLPPGIDYEKFQDGSGSGSDEWKQSIVRWDPKIVDSERKALAVLKIESVVMDPKWSEEDREQWLARAMKRNTEILALHERLRPLSKSSTFASHIIRKYSRFSSSCQDPSTADNTEDSKEKVLDFSSIVSQTEDRAVISREALLQLVHQHLSTKGYWRTIKCLGEESGVKYNGLGKNDQVSHVQALLQMGIKNPHDIYKLPSSTVSNLEDDNEVQTASILNHLDPEHVPEIKKKLWTELANQEEDNMDLLDDNKTIRSATLNKLVEKLTDHAVNDPKFLKTFLCTYRSFTVPEILLAKLLERYQVPNAPINSSHADEEWENIKFQIQLRTGNVIQKWIDDYFHLDWNQQMIHMLSKFIDDFLLRNKQTAKMGKTIFSKLNRKLTSGNDVSEQIFSTEPPQSIVPKTIFSQKLDLFDVNDTELARQLTIREYDIYKLIEPVEFLNLAWSKEKLKHRAPHVIEMTHRFNILSNWAAVSIVTTESLKERKAKFAKAVNLAKECFKLNNFNSMKAILGGLENAAVHRLRFTKDDLVAAVTNELTQMINVTSQERSFKNLRSHILSCSPPLVPFLGVYCTDLTFIEDGNQDIVPSKKTGRNLINWTKRKLVFNVISEVQQYQYKPYNLQKIFQIQQAIESTFHSHKYVDDPEMFKYSLEREPRNAEKNTLKQ